jgi:hypothetical protein
MNLDKKTVIITGVLFLAYFVYLYILLTNWNLASGGNNFIGIFQGVIPLSAIIFIGLVLVGDIKVAIPVN